MYIYTFRITKKGLFAILFFAKAVNIWNTVTIKIINIQHRKIMFNFIKEKLKKIYSHVTQKLHSIFSLKTIDEATIQEVEKLLITSDTGVSVTKSIIQDLQTAFRNGALKEGNDIKQLLEQKLIDILPQNKACESAQIYLLVGINGSGKTTFAGKLAQSFRQNNKSCLIAAADTFRAAAPEQLSVWAKQAQAELLIGKANQDPASVTFDACEQFKEKKFDRLIIDTAGRLQTKENLMKELEKIKKIVARQLPNHQICTLLTIDAMLGQNSLEQATIFHQATQLDGIILTKVDGTAKGGIVFAITTKLNIPVAYISYGEHIDDMTTFDATTYVANLLGDQKYQSHKQAS